ncbi:MAG: hypothetical protein K8R21_10105 [Leptospira sp.]|nr:hypothetical protein [Leptospira sp.]
MKIISFGYTADPYIAGVKSVTRRNWLDKYALQFDPPEIFSGYDKSPRFGGKKAKESRLISLTKEHISTMPDSDYEAEGFKWLDEHPQFIHKIYKDFSSMHQFFLAWRKLDKFYWVVRFEDVS